MSEPDWLGPAQDALKDKGLYEAAGCLGTFFELVAMMEAEVTSTLARRPDGIGPALNMIILIIAKARGESRDATLARLAPPPPQTPPEPWWGIHAGTVADFLRSTIQADREGRRRR